MDIQIIYEDSDMLVVNKPAGLIVNRADTTKSVETLQDFMDKSYVILGNEVTPESKKEGSWTSQDDSAALYKTSQQTFYERSGIVHRLDKETSGIILVAKNPKAFENLQKQFKERIVHKTYLALAHGKITPIEGEINVPVGRLPFNRKRFGVVAGGRESLTRYKVIWTKGPSTSGRKSSNKQIEQLSLVELYPQTGRTHQIRVHLQYIHHPIFADELYAGRKIAREDRKILQRVFLHASQITFLHPTTGKEMHFTADLPEELQKVLEVLPVSV